METLNFLFAIAVMICFTILIVRWLSWVLTEYKGPLFHTKPFNCKPCLNFWIGWAGNTALAVYLSRAMDSKVIPLVLIALFIALSNYFYINSKTTINE